MNGRLGLVGLSMVFALLCACGGGAGSNTTAGPGNGATGTQRPANVAGFIYVANRASNNVSAFAIDTTTRSLTAVPGSPFPTGSGPMAITVTPNSRFLYVTNAGSQDVSAYSIDDATGTLSAVPGSPYSAGDSYAFDANTVLKRNPSSVSVDPSGKFAFVVAGGDYGAVPGAAVPFLIPGKIWAFTINGTTGAWTPISGSPYDVHNNRNPITFDSTGKFAYVSSSPSNAYNDIPRAGSIITFAIDAATGVPTQVSEVGVAGTSGQTPVTIHPTGKFAYVASDAGMSSFSIDPASGTLSSTDSAHGLTQSSFHTFSIDPAGKFLYASDYDPNRNGNGIAAFTIDGSTGRLFDVAGSPYPVGMEYLVPSTPYPLTIDPSGNFVYMGTGGTAFCKTVNPCTLENEPGKIWGYNVNASTGALADVAGSPFAIASEPLSVTFDPLGKAAYALGRDSGSGTNPGNWIYAYSRNATTGALGLIGSSMLGNNPTALTIAGVRQ